MSVQVPRAKEELRIVNSDATERSQFSRRQLLASGMTLGFGSLASTHALPSTIKRALATPPAGSDLGAVKHVVFIMQENRSFDHYFGAYKGVLGFNDHSSQSLGVFSQPYGANMTDAPVGFQLPYHFDTSNGRGECTHDISHDWAVQHLSRAGGLMNAFVSTHAQPQFDGPACGPMTMGYYTRSDLPYHYALADAFTICDRYHCSALGPTHPNRLMAMTGTIDPSGQHGGPVVTTNTAQALFSANWTTVPELLEDAGVSWKTYTPPGQGYVAGTQFLGFGNTILPYFKQFARTTSPLYRKAFLPSYPNDFASDVRTGTLPSVSWIISPNGYDEHPPGPPSLGAHFIDGVLRTLVANRNVWAKTVVFITYDENGGFFDHVPPPVAPVGTPGEYLTARHSTPGEGSISGPIGLGFRVPMLVVSPFSRGGYVSSNLFDHTSQIRFLEHRFGIRANRISTWRRRAVGDLTSTLHMKRALTAFPTLPVTASYPSPALTAQGCSAGDVAELNRSQPAYGPTSPQSMPTQESGSARRLNS